MTYIKYIRRDFKNNLSRFIAVVAIITLGIGFLVGLRTSSSDILSSVNNSYVDTNIYDINLKSSIGFSEETLKSLNNANSTSLAAYISEDLNSTLNGKLLSTRLISTPLSTGTLNKTVLLSGRYPNKANECVVLDSSGVYSKANINDLIKVKDSVSSKFTTYTVTGIVSSSVYLSKFKELNLMASNQLDLILFVDSTLEDFPLITDIYIKYESISTDHFNDSYFRTLNSYKEQLESSSNNMISIRRTDIIESIKSEISLKLEKSIRDSFIGSNASSIEIDKAVKSELLLKENYILEEARSEYDNTYSKKEDIYILDLKSNQSYVTLKESTSKIDKVATFFPIFFYFIAALVALTTITRLVDEERNTIGIFKSLGYSKFKIVLKYLIYAVFVSILGSILGNLIGIFLLPYVIFNSFSNIYVLPPIVYNVVSAINLSSVIIMIATITLVSLYVALETLKERPANLLLPKAPRPGKRIFLEHINFIWKRTPFKYKNMLRNIFRYKKNLVMMMIGVGGCVALLLTSFSVREEFSKLATVQFSDVVLYDLEANSSDSNLMLENTEGIKTSTGVNKKNIYLDDSRDYQISRIITGTELFSDFNFTNKKTTLDFKDGDVFIDRQTSDEFNLELGETLELNDLDTKYTITGIFENHVKNYIFIYDTSSKEVVNTYFINLDEGASSKDVTDQLESLDISKIEVISQVKESYEEMLRSIVLILIVVIISSAILAIIVIYNLTNINISERIKEIATLKVLGYQNTEVYGYIYREVFLLSLFGVLFGFILGPILNTFVIATVQTPGYFLNNNIHSIYYLYSFIITLFIVIIVDLLFIKKIKNISMALSLKSPE